MAQKEYSNKYATLFGVLCVTVVYMHSGWIGGFDVYTLGFEVKILRAMTGLLFMSVVPAFFILWGYLSNKYFYDNGTTSFAIKDKIIQFYPLYLIIFIAHLILNWEDIVDYSNVEILGGVLGVYTRSGFYGGNIYTVIFFVLLTIYAIKLFPADARLKNIIYATSCLVVTKVLPHESTLCYVKYFGYYSAFFLGVLLKDYDIFEILLKNKKLLFYFICFSMIVPLLNLFDIYVFEIQYLPNSPEHLLFVISIVLIFLKIITLIESKYICHIPLALLNKIGNKAYFHFMVHALVIHFISFFVGFIISDKVYIQILVIFSTSLITIFIFYPIYSFLCNLSNIIFKKIVLNS